MADDEEEEVEIGVFISMDKFMEVLDHLMEVCVTLSDAVKELEESLEPHPILTLVKKPDPEREN